ncbi:glycosyltransferase family 4 protein [soil metagenome]
MQLTALVEQVEHVCCRYRLTAFQPALAAAGISLNLIALPKSLLARLRLYREMANVDGVVLQRTLLSRFELSFLRSHAKQLLFDFDDAIWLRDSYAANSKSHKRERRFRQTLRVADRVFAGNDFLAATAKRYNANVTVVPTCVGFPEREVSPPRVEVSHGGLTPPAQQKTTLVWVGSSSTLQSLERIRPILQTLGQRVPGLKLKLICDRFATFDPLPVENVTWHSETETDKIASSDIGIAWMPDDDWSRGKCGLKVLQYMAAGLPVIANAVGVHSQMIRHGETGFLAETVEDWTRAVTILKDNNLRQRLGDAGHKAVERDYSVSVGARRWINALQTPALRAAC